MDDDTGDLPADRSQRTDGEDELADVLETALTEADPIDHNQGWATFAASYLGFCPRQTYLVHLGIRDNTGWRGRFRARRLIQDYLQKTLEDTHPHLKFTPSFAIDTSRARIVGRPTAYDPKRDIAYHVKPRNGWYKFKPPIDRHLNQLHLYMRGLDVDRGQLLYISMSDLADIRVWPADYQDAQHVPYDAERASRLTEKAELIRDKIVTNGIATTTDEIPFERCDCYLCQTEDVDLPARADTTPAQLDAETTSDNQLSATSSSATTRSRSSQEFSPSTLDAAPFDVTSDETVVLSEDTKHIPADLRDEHVWVVWDCEQKLALAPWQAGTMYPCEWAEEKDVDPRRPFEKAQMVAELPIDQIHNAWPFPEGDALPSRVKPAVLLPHDSGESPLTFVDFDDVRDPVTGAVPMEVQELLDHLGGYAELSRSGTGVHCWVRGGLPEGVTTFTAPLERTGHVEIYDHSRFTGGTWLHIQETPLNDVPEASASIERLLVTYLQR